MKKKVYQFIVILFLFIHCSNEKNHETTNISGKAIFKERCINCHGANGKLGLNGAKDLSKCNLSSKSRITVVTNGRCQMPSFKEILSAEEIEAVAKYTEHFKAEK